MLAQRREEKWTVILDPKFTFKVCEFDYSRFTLSIPVCWLQVFFTKPDLITTPPGGLGSGAVGVDVEEQIYRRLLISICECIKLQETTIE